MSEHKEGMGVSDPHRENDALDITERERAEVAVRASEVRYRRLFETAQDAILILDGDTGKIIDSNPLLGYCL